MKPEKLTICGWGPYKDLAEIDFRSFGGQGLFLITGATGAGKTTIFDALTYALYGALSGEVRDKERSSVRSDFADADTPTYVELEMVHKGKRYYIKRNPEYLRPKKRSGGNAVFTKEKENAVLRIEDDKVIEGVKEVNAYMKEILALDYPQFKQLSMIAQGEFARLLTAPPKDKTKIFREIFGTGIYERFTHQLGQKARAQYLLIMEQKHKLEEVVKLLEDSLNKSDLEVEVKEEFQQLIRVQNWNYEALEKYLDGQKASLKEHLKTKEEYFRGLEKELVSCNEKLLQIQEENKRINEYINCKKQGEMLVSLAETMADKETQAKKAANAGWVEPAQITLQNACKQLQLSVREQEALCTELFAIEQELGKMLPLWEKQEEVEAFLQKALLLEEDEKELEIYRKELGKKLQEEMLQKKVFLEEEKKSIELKQKYEEAVRTKRREAIGIAAGFLTEGQPCPVCGSLEHPNPAAGELGALSEQELEELKTELDLLEKKVNRCYGAVVSVQTQVKGLKEQIETTEESVAAKKEYMKTALEQDDKGLLSDYAGKKAELGLREFRQKIARIQKLQAVIQEKQARGKQLEVLLKEQQSAKAKAEEAFREVLEQYGFSSAEEYEQAHLPRSQREKLAKEVEDYRKKVETNQKLKEHLEQNISGQELIDAQPLREQMSALTEAKEKALKAVKKYEQLLHEVERTYKELRSKRNKLEELSAEYGYIKELENIASGNNAKKLVFEQYVLASYFEEILSAANIRFKKMTSGRYEMHRSQEVGDGRTKDNLEIQVMDFYTGKHRSVRTLSGGESFKASLSLALGLSDVIQAMNGGIQVEALFIDEGFGSLDSESLDQACETLLSLVESDRLIGIISHVPELRERINKQIVINKQGSGSDITVVV